jgi:hypothetical protein
MNLNKLNKNELLIIIGNMKKDQLIKFIKNKFGGENNDSNIIKEEIKFNNTKASKKINYAMPDNKIYRSLDIIEELNKKLRNKELQNKELQKIQKNQKNNLS